MTKMMMMMASYAFDLNHNGGPTDIPTCKASSWLAVTEGKTKVILERGF
jgi:hypothetical protein